MAERPESNSRERAAMLGLWSVPGIGAKTLEAIASRVALSEVVGDPVSSWLGAVSLNEQVRAGLLKVQRLSLAAEQVEEAAERGEMKIALIGEPGYPDQLAQMAGAPPVMFFKGAIDGPRRRLGMVGTRRAESGFEAYAQAFATEVARAGVGIVSGAADGVDRACHLGAAEAPGPSWAFLGSALDQIDPRQASLMPRVLDTGGTYFSELPPSVRADRTTFPRRNRLIAGASDAVLVMRAGEGSGALYTAKFALDQGKPVLALPGDLKNSAADGGNALLYKGEARICLQPSHACEAVGMAGPLPGASAPEVAPVVWQNVSAEAKRAYEVVGRSAVDFEQVLGETRLPAGALASALCELELLGLVVQRPGKRYERI